MSTEQNMQAQFYALGTMNTVKVFQNNDKEILQKVIDRINEIDDHMSAFKPNSDISRINCSAGKNYVAIHKDTMTLLENSLYFSTISNDSFTTTIGPLVTLWGIGKKTNYIPTQEEILREKAKVNSNDILLDSSNLRAALRNKGQRLDLGGIAKGFAADEAKRILMENGVKNAIINLGGNIVTIGHKEDGTPWRIGIQNPLQQTGQFLGILSASNKTVVTSGVNERFFMKNGIRYHHILDPHTGYPAQSGLLSVTVVCDNSMYADALTTSLFVMGVEKGLKLLEQTGDEAIFITTDNDVILTKHLMEKFKSVNQTYTIKRMGFYGN